MRMLLVPGAGGEGWLFHRLLPVLADRGVTALAVELPGDDPEAGLDRYAQLAADAVTTDLPGIEPLVVVAQSMGAYTAAVLCDLLPVDRLVFLNAMIPQVGESAGDWWQGTGHDVAFAEAAAAAGREPDMYDAAAVFFHDVPEPARSQGLRGGRTETDAAFTSPFTATAWRTVPITVLCGADDRLFPVDFQVRVARERLGIEPTILPGGHLLALSQPEALARALVPVRADPVD
jgi:pimeloyl-ACP methyl ester carboxylesterase